MFTDPFDKEEVRWNPVARQEFTRVRSNDALTISLPTRYDPKGYNPDTKSLEKLQKDGRYPVDKRELKKMAAPCLVHMLDAFYSSLVMSHLKSLGVSTFVGIHDCWLVPETQLGELRSSMDLAARDWYVGLGSVYKELRDYLNPAKKARKTKKEGNDENAKHFERIDQAYQKWEQTKDSYTPKFKAKLAD